MSRDDVVIEDLGQMRYEDAHARQREIHARVLAARDSRGPAAHILFVEHDPVITMSAKARRTGNLLADETHLRAHGVRVVETDRGGDITYHGPGQLVCYPIVDLQRLGIRLHAYLRLLEQCVIETLACWGVRGLRDASATGVWVPDPAGPPDDPHAKICAIGVRVSRWVTLHGLALNVRTNLDHFGLIVPCGLHRPVTSLEREIGDRCPSMGEVRERLGEVLAEHLGDR